MNSPSYLVRRLSLAAFLPTSLTACSPVGPSFLDPHGPVAHADRNLFYFVIAAMLIVVVPVFVITPLFAWRYRRGNRRSEYRPKWEFSGPLEFLIWGVPIAVTVILSGVLWQQTHRLDPYRSVAAARAQQPLTIQVIGLDWKWLFIYPDQHVAAVDRLVFPAGRPIRLELTSDTVMQSWMVPQLAGQIYAMAGMRTQLNFKADSPGAFTGLNTQYNGAGFARQRFTAYAVPPARFDQWVRRATLSGAPLDAAHYEQLRRKSVPDRPVVYSNVAPGLFGSVIDRYANSGRAEAGKGSAK